MSEVIDIDKLKKIVEEFAKERDWQQFHNPKNLAMAINVEASELLEIFQWLTLEQAESINRDAKKFQNVKDEIADIFVYLVRISDILKINLPEAINQKMEKNREKYPIEMAKGNAKKYTEF